MSNFIMMFSLLVAGYVFWRVIYPLQTGWGWKVFLASLLLIVAFKFHLLHVVGGDMFFAPPLPYSVLIVSAWLFSILLIYFVLLLVVNLFMGFYRLVRFCLRRGKGAISRVFVNRMNLVLFCLSVILATAGTIEGTGIPNVRKETIILDHFPKEADGMTIAVLADLHADSMTRADRIRSIVEKTNALMPDIVVIAGDFVDGTVRERSGDLLPLKDLSARVGVFGVPGNHEYFSGYEDWMEFLSKLGIRMLLNEHVFPGDGKVALAGVTDPVASRWGRDAPDVALALKGVPSGSSIILLSHQPRLAPEAVEHGVDLQISGHTHGGMILGFNRLIAGFNGGFVSGTYRTGDMVLFVSNGAGIWNGLPIRIGVPAEIVLLHLKRA